MLNAGLATDPTIVGAWIGVGGALVGTIIGAALGYGLTAISQRRASRGLGAAKLAELRQFLYYPKDQVDLEVELDQLATALTAAGVGRDALAALRKIAKETNQSSQQYHSANPDEPASADERSLLNYDELRDSLADQLSRNGRRKARKSRVTQAVLTIGR